MHVIQEIHTTSFLMDVNQTIHTTSVLMDVNQTIHTTSVFPTFESSSSLFEPERIHGNLIQKQMLIS